MNPYEGTFVLPYRESDGSFTPARMMASSIFLAGPCPRRDYHEDWRFEAIRLLREMGFHGNIISPTNDRYQEMRAKYSENGDIMLKKQTEWERTMMHMASAIVFWVPRSEKWPAMTTNVEFGEWYKRTGVFFGYPQGALRNEYLELKALEQGKTIYHDLKDTLKAAMDWVYRPQKRYFTSDTHFGQQRTLDLSRRPFHDTHEMDLMMISNWNKTVPENGIVYHAGDFIDPDRIDELPELLSNLNFSELHWVLGNYDKKMMDKIQEMLKSPYIAWRDITLYAEGCYVNLTKQDGTKVKFRVIHELSDIKYDDDDDITYLFGHIHALSFAKYNGFGLGTDFHQFTPIDEEQVLWYKNAMQYWDSNVYCCEVKHTETDTNKTFVLDPTDESYIWPTTTIEEYMARPEIERLVFWTTKNNESADRLFAMDPADAIGYVEGIEWTESGTPRIRVKLDTSLPEGKRVFQLTKNPDVSMGFFLAGLGEISSENKREILANCAVITRAYVRKTNE